MSELDTTCGDLLRRWRTRYLERAAIHEREAKRSSWLIGRQNKVLHRVLRDEYGYFAGHLEDIAAWSDALHGVSSAETRQAYLNRLYLRPYDGAKTITEGDA